MQLEHRQIATNGVNLHVVVAGPEHGPAVILLHGFPEFWYGWRRQIAPLAQAGYRVYAVDQRGYNLSDKPAAIDAYRIDKLAADIEGIMDTIQWHQVSLVGHDWGGVVAWWVACRNPARIGKLVAINAPHFDVFRRRLRRNFAQMRKSWYIFFFQIPWLAEKMVSRGNCRWLAKTLRGTSLAKTFSDEEIENYRQAWAQPDAVPSMLAWYRAALQQKPPQPRDLEIHVPTLLIWGAKDRFLTRELAQPSIDLCEQGELVFIDDATHWVHHEKAAEVNALIDRFLRGRG